MNISVISETHQLFLKMNEISFNIKEVEKQLGTLYSEGEIDHNSYLDYLFETGSFVNLAYFRNWMSEEEVSHLIKTSDVPFLVFKKDEKNKIVPAILYRSNNRCFIHNITESGQREYEFKSEYLSDFLKGQQLFNLKENDNKIFVLTCFPNQPIYSNDDNFKPGSYYEKIKTFQRLLLILKSEKREIFYIYIYAIIAGIIGLSLPLGVQSIIGFVSSGQVSTSVIVLISFIIIGIMITGGLQVMQLSLVEYIQQRLFTKTAFEFAYRIPKIKIESVLKYYPPELMNRFFDIITLQKGLAKLLLEFSAALLQVLLGLMLLSLYHSTFIFFGIFLVTILFLIIRLTGPKGLKTSLKESKYKYMVANWLEEVAKSLSTFKQAGYSNLPLEKTDYIVSNYLHARNSHFNVLITQYLSFVAFKTLITGGLLILGCILLVEKQINIGQFVASEIIIILIMNAVEKIIMQLDTAYDVLTSIEKIGHVIDLPIEIPKGINLELPANAPGLSIGIKKLKYKYPAEPEYILKNIDLEIKPSERICISGYSSSGKTTFINIILGFLTSYEGIVTLNNISLRNINKNSLLSLTGNNASQEDLFDGTILENITLGKNNIRLEDVQWATDCVDLTEFIQSQSEGFHTRLINGRLGISESVARKIIIARSIVFKPKLLILEDVLLGLEKETKLKMLNVLLSNQYNWTVIIISNDENIMKMCDRTIILKGGTIVSEGSYEEIKQNIHFKDLI
ncbi:xenobiotic-transporting ATPase [Sporocytophaga myxococcoides]|uniref:Xenobiotic-transporting ATPase n=1 Tax=Sporocytophaga myxococcoides TaxID=153721 RepID=A0A098LGG4_9BACT|nr:ABC transporter ATP-binding protein [Sporocytophaga myxococcoides]GAL85549.1 xenobiotic-transporting ATPase [Sporocytophaga myxococcoides]